MVAIFYREVMSEMLLAFTGVQKLRTISYREKRVNVLLLLLRSGWPSG